MTEVVDVVQAAVQGQPGETVAIKVLKEELASDPDIVMRFLRERSVLLRIDAVGSSCTAAIPAPRATATAASRRGRQRARCHSSSVRAAAYNPRTMTTKANIWLWPARAL